MKPNWIEPIEVWSSFRAERKANIIETSFFMDLNEILKVCGAHDTYKYYCAKYKRSIEIRLVSNEKLYLLLKDQVECIYKKAWIFLY